MPIFVLLCKMDFSSILCVSFVCALKLQVPLQQRFVLPTVSNLMCFTQQTLNKWELDG